MACFDTPNSSVSSLIVLGMISKPLSEFSKYFLSCLISYCFIMLNHSSEAMTLAYLGLDQASTETMLDQIDFG